MAIDVQLLSVASSTLEDQYKTLMFAKNDSLYSYFYQVVICRYT